MADIELVVKISEKAYNALTHTEFDANLIVDEMRKAIANGTPLLKGHGRLKDIDKVERLLDLEKTDNAIAKALKNIIESVPTVIEADKGE